jgi:hypothetical protein
MSSHSVNSVINVIVRWINTKFEAMDHLRKGSKEDQLELIEEEDY